MVPSLNPFRLDACPRSSWSHCNHVSGKPGGGEVSFGTARRELKSPKIPVKWCSAAMYLDSRWNPSLGGRDVPWVELAWNASDRIWARFWFRSAAAFGPAARCTLAKQNEICPSMNRAHTQPLLPPIPPRPVLTRSQSTHARYGATSSRTYTSSARPTMLKPQTLTKPRPPPTRARASSTRASSWAWRCVTAEFSTTLRAPSSTSSWTPMT
mmetsp:Transcript_35569/g.99968  ORF Transcript_35569/g.99968 Transcript_35569/m.99968 type:complete len:211 (+) Transcript_35569:301-933(+)